MFYFLYTDAEMLNFIFLFGCFLFLVVGIINLATIIGMWKVFKKAGKRGWECLIPYYNHYVLTEISGLNWWWFLFSFAPLGLAIIPGMAILGSLASVFALFNCYYNLSKKFNKGVGFAICLTLFTPICITILGFSKNIVYSNVYVSNNGVFGPSGSDNKNNVNNSNYNYQNNNNMQPVNNNMVNNVQQMPTTNDVNNGNTTTINNQWMESIQPQQFSFCGNCGAKLDSSVKFCPNCGKEKI